jgi:hypothetical protein
VRRLVASPLPIAQSGCVLTPGHGSGSSHLSYCLGCEALEERQGEHRRQCKRRHNREGSVVIDSHGSLLRVIEG